MKGIAVLLFFSISAFGMGNADPVITKVMLNKFEGSKKNHFRWDASAFIGKDLHKLWIKTEGNILKKDMASSELRILYGAAVLPYWDLLVGIKHDYKPDPKINWLELGMQGMAPYFIDSSISLFVNEKAYTGLRAEFEKEFMLTQKWALESELEVNLNRYNDSGKDVESGVDSLEVGLRLLYQVVREFSPYMGLSWEKSYGGSKR